jgi:lipopolysaccharide export system permease protein
MSQPKILPLYIIKEHFAPFTWALVTINLVFILNILYRDLGKFLSKGVALPVILEFLFLNLAWMIALAAPMAVLTATIMALGRLSADNEITAVRAGGVSLYQILIPLLLVAGLLASGLILFNNHVLPEFNHRARLLAMDIARKKPMINLEPGVVYSDLPNYNILVQQVHERDSVSYAENLVIDDQNDDSVIKTTIADSAELRFDSRTGLLIITMFNGEAHEVNFKDPGTFKRAVFQKSLINIPMSEVLLTRSQSEYRGDREKSAAALMENVREYQKRMADRVQFVHNKMLEQFEKYSGANIQPPPVFANLLTEHQNLQRTIQAEIDLIKGFQKSININLVEVHKKYSIPTACVVFILVGAPLGILIRQRGWAVAGGLSFGFFMIYWICLIGGEILADRQIITPFLAMWSPNIIVGIIAMILVAKSISGVEISLLRRRMK